MSSQTKKIESIFADSNSLTALVRNPKLEKTQNGNLETTKSIKKTKQTTFCFKIKTNNES